MSQAPGGPLRSCRDATPLFAVDRFHWSGRTRDASKRLTVKLAPDGVGLAVPGMSHCRVDANGVPAEWVEAAIAAEGQLTLVLFLDQDDHAGPTREGQAVAEQLAVVTGARVLMVLCRCDREQSLLTRVERGITAYRWLLGEGCDLTLSAFACDSANASLLSAVRMVASARGVPLPSLADVPLPPAECNCP